MICSPPKFRTDLTVSRQQTAGGTVFVVKDPVSGEFFRFREVEQFIAEQLDGGTGLDVVRQRTEETFSATLPTETLNAFIRNLEETGLLETEKTRKKKPEGQPGRVRGNLLYLRFKSFDPDRLFNRLVRRVRFFFTPHFVVLSAALILLAAGITVANWGEFRQDLPRLARLAAVPLFLAMVFLVASAHEFSHGLTCKHFGGEVHEIGFMLIYFQPAFYCNVTDSWLFPEKSKRLWVSFAGPYFELFLWALAVLAWRLTDGETWINYLALIVMTSSGIKTLLNFNPFIKFDGYYLLSDYLELPNLRRKSFRYIGSLIERLLGVGPPMGEEFSRREQGIYLVYGLVAIVSSFSILAYIIATAGGYLIENRRPEAVLVSTGLLILKFRRKFLRLFGKASDSFDEDDDGEPSNTPSSPEPAERRSGRNRPWKRRITLTALTGATLAVLFFGHMELRISGPLNALPVENADVRSEVEGIIEQIYVDEGDEVRAGDVIARLVDTDLLAELGKTEAETRETHANLKKLEAGPTSPEIEVAKTSVSKAEGRLKYAQSRLARHRNLLQEGLLSRKDFEDTADLTTAAENDLAERQSRLNLLLAGSRPEEIEATKAKIDRLETQRRYLEQQLRLLNVVSPAKGTVATPSRQLKELRGRLVKKGDLIAKVYDLKTVTAQILISEKEIAGVEVGEKVVLRTRAYPDQTFYGTVTSIATSAQQTLEATSSSSSAASANKTILVTTQIDNHSLLLKPEMTGQAKILCGPRRIVDLITRRLARTFKVEFWSWW